MIAAPLTALYASPVRLLKSVRLWMREHVFWAILTCVIEFIAAGFGIYHEAHAGVEFQIFLPGGTSQVIHRPKSEGGAVRLVLEASPTSPVRPTQSVTEPAQPVATGPVDPSAAHDSVSPGTSKDQKPRLEDYLHEVRSQGVPLAELVDEADPQKHPH